MVYCYVILTTRKGVQWKLLIYLLRHQERQERQARGLADHRQ